MIASTDEALTPYSGNQTLSDFQSHLLNDWQRDLPLVSRPFEAMANTLDVSNACLMAQLEEYVSNGTISRVGPVFCPNRLGASSLVAVAVSSARLMEVADLINSYEEVNHNYEREHQINLWFVATAADKDALSSVLDDIEQRIGLTLLRLPLIKDYHIDLGFELAGHKESTVSFDKVSNNRTNETVEKHKKVSRLQCRQSDFQPLNAEEADALLAIIQSGLPLVERPYEKVAKQISCTEHQVIQALNGWIIDGTIKRLGVIVRHHELGYRANAMVVWNVSETNVDSLGRALGAESDVTLCYQRPRIAGRWPYNLFCMIHGQDKATVSSLVESLVIKHRLQSTAHAVLFSGRRFKQRGARYRQTTGTPRNEKEAMVHV